MFVFGSRSLRRVLTFAFLVPTLVLGTLLVTSPANAQRIRASFWGMHDPDWVVGPSVPVGAANFTLAGTYWSDIQTGRSTFNWDRLDQQVAGAEAVGAQPMIVLGQTPRFYSPHPRSRNYEDYMPRIRPWRRYVTKVAKRYGTRLDYQIWPEPNIIQNWHGPRNRVGSPRQMAKLTMVASKAVNRAAGRRAKVISPAVAVRLKSQRRWTLDFFRQQVGGKRVHRYVDAIAIDPFPTLRGTPEDSYRLMQSIRHQLRRIGVRKPFWNNEINYGVTGGGSTDTLNYRTNKQQSYVIRTYVLSAAARMQRTYWLSWPRNAETSVHLADDSGNALPPAKSYEMVYSWLNGTNFQGCDKTRNGVWVCTAKRGRTEVRRIYWRSSGRATVKLPRSATRIENQEGYVTTTTPRRKRITYKPIMVASRR